MSQLYQHLIYVPLLIQEQLGVQEHNLKDMAEVASVIQAQAQSYLWLADP